MRSQESLSRALAPLLFVREGPSCVGSSDPLRAFPTPSHKLSLPRLRAVSSDLLSTSARTLAESCLEIEVLPIFLS